MVYDNMHSHLCVTHYTSFNKEVAILRDCAKATLIVKCVAESNFRLFIAQHFDNFWFWLQLLGSFVPLSDALGIPLDHANIESSGICHLKDC